jgi:aminoglycoside 6'-N-acetyltransferase
MRRSAEIDFVPVTPAHYPLLRQWLAEPHVKEWWGEPDVELGYIRDMVEGRDSTRPFLIAVDDVPVGYIQYWFIGHHQNEPWTARDPWLLELPPETIGVDLAIGRREHLSNGIGSAALAAFVAVLRDEGHTTIIIDPDRSNARALRAYAKAGFRPVLGLEGCSGDALIMRHDPNANPLT